MKREGRKKRFFFFAMKTAHSSSRLPFFFFSQSRENRLDEISYLHSVSTEKNKNAHVPTTSHHARKPNSKRSSYTAKKKKREFTKRFKKKKRKGARWNEGNRTFSIWFAFNFGESCHDFLFFFFFFASSSYFATIEAAHVLCKGKKRSTRRKKKRVVCGKYFLNAAPAMTRFTSSPSLHRAFCSACECPLTKYGRMQPWQKENKKKKTTHQQKSS